MNERIEELFGKALDQAVPETWTTLNPTQLSKLKDKFAELIVRECSVVARNTNLEDVEGGDSAVLREAAKQIQKHFGIE